MKGGRDLTSWSCSVMGTDGTGTGGDSTDGDGTDSDVEDAEPEAGGSGDATY